MPRAPRVLLLYGRPAIGKTHLLKSTVRRYRARSPRAIVVQTTAAELVDELVRAIQLDPLGAASLPLTRAAMLVVDDLHVLHDKPLTQREVARLFRALVAHGGRVVCAVRSLAEIPVQAAALRYQRGASLLRLPAPSSGSLRRILAARAPAGDARFTPSVLARVTRNARGDVGRAIGASARAQFVGIATTSSSRAAAAR